MIFLNKIEYLGEKEYLEEGENGVLVDVGGDGDECEDAVGLPGEFEYFPAVGEGFEHGFSIAGNYFFLPIGADVGHGIIQVGVDFFAGVEDVLRVKDLLGLLE